jgi:hypothetical protein
MGLCRIVSKMSWVFAWSHGPLSDWSFNLFTVKRETEPQDSPRPLIEVAIVCNKTSSDVLVIL